MATSITTIQSTDLITNSRADINNNFDSLLNNKIETDVLDTDTTLAANSDSKVATQKAVKAYVDAGGNVNASETNKGIVEEATQAEVDAGTATGGTGARLFVNPSTLSSYTASRVGFGGNGSDGALSISSGTTNIDCGAAAVVVKNYTSISITGTGSLTFSNPNSAGTLIVLKSQGDVTLTSSSAPMINASGMGAAGGGEVVVTTEATTYGNNGTNGVLPFTFWTTGGGVGGTNDGVGESAGASIVSTLGYKTLNTAYTNKCMFSVTGAGGGSGGARRVAGSTAGTATSGAGGKGGGALYIECAGSLNFTTASGISVAGENGGNGSCITGNRLSAGGGGGGAGGYCLIKYVSLTSASGTINISGGTGGTGAHIQTGGVFVGVDGGSGGSSVNLGTSSTGGTSGAGGNGGNGGIGASVVETI